MSFTHLQIKSGYSLMQSTITIEKLVKKASEHNFQALALTDENVLYGAIPFYKACKRYGIKPIVGLSIRITDAESNLHTCVLLAKNNVGYQQLMKLSTTIQTDPDKDLKLEDLSTYTNGLIGILPTSNACMEERFETKSFEQISHYIHKWEEMFSSDDFYLGIEGHSKVLQKVRAFVDQGSYSVVALNDVCYLDEKDNYAYDCLQAMKNGHSFSSTTLPTSSGNHLRSAEEMSVLFGYWPEVLEATTQIMGKCHMELNFNERLLPSYPVPENIDAHSFLEQLCWKKLESRFSTVTDEIKMRLSYELSVIESMGFSDYFLIVWDFIHFAKENNILVGPGRGSAAGSLVAYILSITNVDPIKHELLFERFLNPERTSMPDIDIDFADDRRDEVIEYVREKYGAAHVAQIITFGTFAARSLLRELSKTMNIDQKDLNYILKEIPVQANKQLIEYVQASEDLKLYIKQSNSLKALFTIAMKLEGLPRHVSTHAAGVVISEKALVEHIPLTIGTSSTMLTQYPMNDLESIGLLKMDFLGLRNLTLLDRVRKSIQYTNKVQLDIDNFPENDEKTFRLLQSGMTNGIFQLESDGMKQVLTKLKPTTFEDIVAVNALFRPGPMENIPIYISRKHKQSSIDYPHPDLKPILEKTFGVLIYQEQIMQIASKIAGFSLGQADILRRAVSKKQQQLMDEQREAFVAGCLQNGYSKEVAAQIFHWIVQFSNYGFNRSHAVAYSKISYQLAYVKAHYPANFFTELLTSHANQQDKINQYRKEAKTFGLDFLPPSINKSFGKYVVEKGQIRMGLLTIKGVGNQAVQEIIRARKDGPFKNLFDFCLRISVKVVNRQTMELLIMAGAFDETYSNRASLLASIDRAMEQGELFREFADQPSLFQDKMDIETTYVEIDDFNLMKKLADEKELIGIYISSHPIASYREKLRMNGYVSLSQVNNLVGKRNVQSAIIIQGMKTIRTKRGDQMAFVTIGDETTDMEAVVFPDTFRENKRFLNEESILSIKGNIEERNNKIQWIIQDVRPFDKKELEVIQNKRLFIKCNETNSDKLLNEMKKIASSYPGDTPVIIHQEDTKKTYQLSGDYFVDGTFQCLRELKAYFGKENVVLKKG